MKIAKTFQPLTNAKKNFNFLCGGDSGYPSVDTVKLGLGRSIEKMYWGRVEDYLFMGTVTSKITNSLYSTKKTSGAISTKIVE